MIFFGRVKSPLIAQLLISDKMYLLTEEHCLNKYFHNFVPIFFLNGKEPYASAHVYNCQLTILFTENLVVTL